jgi:hypothetical protein
MNGMSNKGDTRDNLRYLRKSAWVVRNIKHKICDCEGGKRGT